MNFSGKIQQNGLRWLAGIATAALAIAWVGEPLVSIPWLVRPLFVGAFLVLPLLLSRWESRKQVAAERLARRYVESLCQLDDHDLGNSLTIESLPRIAERHPWHSVLQRVRERLMECGRRADEAEHACTSYEVRLRRLEKDNRRIAEILDRAPEPIIAINQYDEVTWANEPARAVLDVQVSSDSLAKVDLIRCPPLVNLLLETRRRKTESHRVGEFEIVDRAGQTRWFRVICRTWTETSDSAGQHGALAVLVDISNEKGIQKRHAEFVAAAAHEMKTPLSSIRAYVELIQDGEVEDEATQEEFWNVVQAQAERLQRLIENLLNIARIEAGVVKVDKQVISVNEVLEQAFEVVKPAAEQKSLQYVLDLSPMYLGIHADRDMILQAAINLLSNAVKYTPDAGKVTLRSRLNDGVALFEVDDTGVGLTPEDAQKVFEKFYRVKKDQKMASGTGLGLPLAKHIIEDVHGGSLTVNSQLNVGSIFRVTLPVAGHSMT